MKGICTTCLAKRELKEPLVHICRIYYLCGKGERVQFWVHLERSVYCMIRGKLVAGYTNIVCIVYQREIVSKHGA